MPEPPAALDQPEDGRPAPAGRAVADWEYKTASIPTFVVRIPARLYNRLCEWANQEHKPPSVLVFEILEEAARRRSLSRRVGISNGPKPTLGCERRFKDTLPAQKTQAPEWPVPIQCLLAERCVGRSHRSAQSAKLRSLILLARRTRLGLAKGTHRLVSPMQGEVLPGKPSDGAPAQKRGRSAFLTNVLGVPGQPFRISRPNGITRSSPPSGSLWPPATAIRPASGH